ncbi:MAG: hypothetical protein ACYSWW_00470 [Planctomycetota bacterium]|jgi:hypothetical protein
MTVESLIDSFTQYVSWLYSERQWERWELLAATATVLFVLLLILVRRRRGKAAGETVQQVEENSPIVGIRLREGKGSARGFGDFKGRRLNAVSKGDGKLKRWKDTAKKWQNFQKLVEELQQEVRKYKQAEKNLEQQFMKIKGVNERLLHEINENKQTIRGSAPGGTRAVGGFTSQDRIIDASHVVVEDS